MNVAGITAARALQYMARDAAAGKPIDPEHALILFWQAWLERYGIEKRRADEFPLFGNGLTESQAAAVSAFNALWEANLGCEAEADDNTTKG